MTTTTHDPTPALLDLRESLARELAPRPRAVHGALLLLALTGGLALLSLWATEPGPLPVRTQLSFAALLALDAVWVAYFARVLLGRRMWFGHHRVVATTIGLIASLAWVGLSVGIVVARGVWPLGWAAIACALSFAVLAAVLRHRTVREIRRLRELARRLEAQLAC